MERSITLITNYYPPETGAAANRIALMAENFVKAGYETQVLCPLPNYPTGKIFELYKGKSGESETINGVKVTRLWVYATNSANRWERLLAMVSFSFSLVRYATGNTLSKYIFIQASPLLIGGAASWLFSSKRSKIILNVSDLWPLAGKELGKLKPGLTYSFLERIERYMYNKASLVLGQSEEILMHVKKIVPSKQTFLYRNFPDFDLPSIQVNSSPTIKMVYAGLLGIAQGLVELCKNIELPSDFVFHIYGSGPEKESLKAYLKSSGKNIIYKGSLSRKQLHKELIHYDLTIIPLVKRIYGSVPSKIFEYSRLGLPLLYFGGGEGERLVNQNKLGWVVEAGNYHAVNTILKEVSKELENYNKKAIQQRATRSFNSRNQFEDLIKELD